MTTRTRHDIADTTRPKPRLDFYRCFVRCVLLCPRRNERRSKTCGNGIPSTFFLLDAGRRWPTPGARRSLGNDERRHHPEHPLAGLGVRQDVAVECPGARVV